MKDSSFLFVVGHCATMWTYNGAKMGHSRGMQRLYEWK